ncbi:hypothetical protein AB0F24_38575 [Streptomyces platensis]
MRYLWRAVNQDGKALDPRVE